MGRPLTDTLTDEQRSELVDATIAVDAAQLRLDRAVRARHDLWVRLVGEGASQSEVARASGVIRQAVGWAMSHR